MSGVFYLNVIYQGVSLPAAAQHFEVHFEES